MLNNLLPFYVGQKVVYITGISMPKGTIDTIIDIKKSPCKCDTYVILLVKNKSICDIKDFSKPFCRCIDCNTINNMEEHLKVKGYWIASSFRPIQEQTFPLITYSKVLEKELVGSN